MKTSTPMFSSKYSADITTIQELLMGIAVGEMVSYKDIEDAVQRSRVDAAPQIYSALRRVQQSGVLFECVRTVGYKRLTNSEIAINTPKHYARKISRAARRGYQRLAVADHDALSDDEKIKQGTGLSLLGAIAHMTKPSRVQRLEGHAKAVANSSEMPIGRTLEFFQARE